MGAEINESRKEETEKGVPFEARKFPYLWMFSIDG